MGKQTISRTTLAKGVTACVVVAASLGIVQIGEYSLNSTEEAASTAVSSTTGTVAYTPGTYTATAAGIQSDVTVSCTFDEGSITSITVDVSGETAGLGADIGDEMIESFLAAQSSNVDGVSGATITSDALKAALEDCIAQATGGSGDSDEVDEEATEASSSSDEEDADAAETEAADEAETDAAADTETDNAEGATEAAVDTSETETESEADSEVTAAASDSNASSGSGTYTPGTYTATAAGMESDVTVTVTVDETSILSLGIDVSGETDGIGAAIGPKISEQILNAQSADVDGVSGATVTSTAVKTALTDALDQAADGTSESTDDNTDTAAAIAEGETEAVDEPAAIEGDSSTDLAAAADAPFVPGTYTATAQGMESEITVNVTFDEYNIVAVGTLLEGETDGIGADIGEEISNQILEAQSADVDGVSGATVTSTAVKEAVADCIAQAKANTEDAGNEEIETEAVETETAEAETETDTAAAETETEDADESAAIEGDSGFIPGTYTASAAGISSDVTVTCTFDETGLVSIDADVSGETSGIGADIGDTMIARVLEAQSSDVDGVSGATITSNAFKAAVADCMEQAGFAAEEAETETEAESDSDMEAENTAADDSGTEFSAAADAPFVPGTYTATAQGMESEITVNVTFDEYNIVAVGTWLKDETDGVGADIGEEISNQILDAQSAEVDGVSGATVTSTAVKEAAANCIAQAKAGSEGAASEEDETEIVNEEETEAPAATESADSDETVASDEASLSSLYTAGIYSASAEGISSDVVVTVAFDDNSITSIGYDLSGETADIGALIGPEISGQILTAQSADVDGVSGATITSDAFKAAVADCIAQAQAGSSDLVIIGGADGPTSIFLAGTTDEEETEQSETDSAE